MLTEVVVMHSFNLCQRMSIRVSKFMDEYLLLLFEHNCGSSQNLCNCLHPQQ